MKICTTSVFKEVKIEISKAYDFFWKLEKLGFMIPTASAGTGKGQYLTDAGRSISSLSAFWKAIWQYLWTF